MGYVITATIETWLFGGPNQRTQRKPGLERQVAFVQLLLKGLLEGFGNATGLRIGLNPRNTPFCTKPLKGFGLAKSKTTTGTSFWGGDHVRVPAANLQGVFVDSIAESKRGGSKGRSHLFGCIKGAVDGSWEAGNQLQGRDPLQRARLRAQKEGEGLWRVSSGLSPRIL